MNKANFRKALALVSQNPLPWKKIVNLAYRVVEKETGHISGLDGKTARDYLPIKRRTRNQLRKGIQFGDWEFCPLKDSELIEPCEKPKMLSIPCFLDRAVALVITMVMIPLDSNEHIHGQATAFRRNVTMAQTIQSILSGLARYPYYLILDIQSFYHSISNKLIEPSFACLPLESNIKKLLWGFHTLPTKNWEGLPIGVSFVPMLTNLIMRQIDDPLDKLAPFYMRYADDMLFGFDSASERDATEPQIKAIFEDHGFTVHKPQHGDIRHDTFTYLGLEIGPGPLKPGPKALCKLKHKEAYDQIHGWAQHYLQVGARPEIINNYITMAGKRLTTANSSAHDRITIPYVMKQRREHNRKPRRWAGVFLSKSMG